MSIKKDKRLTKPRARHIEISPYFRRSGFSIPALAGKAVNFPAGSLSPMAICKAYNFPKIAKPSPILLGIGSLGGVVTQPDIAAACAYYGIPVPTVKVISVGGASTTQSDPGGANVENMLDLLLLSAVWSYCTDQAAQIVLAIGPNNGTGIANVTTALVKAGCGVINWSWGSPGAGWQKSDRAKTSAAIAAAVAANITVCVASGDNSEDDGTNSPAVDYPCGDVNSWAVGGTRLKLTASGAIDVEQAWGDGRPGDEGGGGGFDPNTPKPAWQNGVVAGKWRGCPDSSANADPASGYQIWADGEAQVVGGTSGASPMTAGLFAACKAGGAVFGDPGPLLYPLGASCFRDIELGSDGYPSVVGWDPATGNGSPMGVQIASALKAQHA